MLAICQKANAIFGKLVPKERDKRISFGIKCTCGCEVFSLAKNTLSAEEKKAVEEVEKQEPNTGWHNLYGITGEDGKNHWYIRRFFFWKKEIFFPEYPYYYGINVIKAVCSSCQKEILLFDNRLHGWDSQDIPEEKQNYVPHFSKRLTKPGKVLVRLEQPDDVEEVNPRLFTSIVIYTVRENHKKAFFDEETA